MKKTIKLVDFLAISENQKYFNRRRLAYFDEIAYSCPEHKTELVVVNGYKIIGWDLSFEHDWEFEDKNPCLIGDYEILHPSDGFTTEPCKVVYCAICQMNRKTHFEAQLKNRRYK